MHSTTLCLLGLVATLTLSMKPTILPTYISVESPEGVHHEESVHEDDS